MGVFCCVLASSHTSSPVLQSPSYPQGLLCCHSARGAGGAKALVAFAFLRIARMAAAAMTYVPGCRALQWFASVVDVCMND